MSFKSRASFKHDNTCLKDAIIIVLFLLCQIGMSSALALDMPDKIRVAVINNADSIELSVRGGYQIISTDTGGLLDKGETFFNRKIEPAAKGVNFGNKSFNTSSIDIIPKTEPSIYLDKRLYKGRLRIVKTKAQKLVAVNEVNLEDYIKGVLYHEVSHRWPIEAIKAQAIASRTYALYQARQNAHRHYHLYSDVSSQVYNGVYAERYRTNKAVDETKGKVLLWKAEPIPAFFHSTCGGHTERASSLWKVELSPLSGVVCKYCKNSPYFFWDYAMEISTLEEALKSAGYMVDCIDSVKITEKNRSGRVDSVIVRGRNMPEKIKAKDLRRMVGPLLLKSTNFDVYVKDDKVYFKGKGWGHGVGMCQWGAFAMAKQRKTAEDILLHYYPGARIIKVKRQK
jgi:stage II sporulation protein D